ncbi:MAG TPA: NAD(P) transhydrogenase subunit alpha [Planctomycetes bacterium]|nr:NAD(P) transhydrogenase subunit alpha [Planctomycetota bacterium]
MSALLVALTANTAESSGLNPVIVGIWVLLLAIFVGFELITKVPPTIHTPLMSGANAISGITLVGALYCAGTGYPALGQVFGFLAITMATINVVGGFLVTDRMLRMFGGPKKKAPKGGKDGGAR